MTITYANIVSWLKQAVSLILLAVVAVTALKMLGVQVPVAKGIPLTMDAAAVIAAMAFVVWKV